MHPHIDRKMVQQKVREQLEEEILSESVGEQVLETRAPKRGRVLNDEFNEWADIKKPTPNESDELIMYTWG